MKLFTKKYWNGSMDDCSLYRRFRRFCKETPVLWRLFYWGGFF